MKGLQKMKKTPKEQIEQFIQRNLLKEKEKWAVGLKSDYYAWDDELSGLRSRDVSAKEALEAIQAYNAFVKDMGLEADFRKWSGGRK